MRLMLENVASQRKILPFKYTESIAGRLEQIFRDGEESKSVGWYSLHKSHTSTTIFLWISRPPTTWNRQKPSSTQLKSERTGTGGPMRVRRQRSLHFALRTLGSHGGHLWPFPPSPISGWGSSQETLPTQDWDPQGPGSKVKGNRVIIYNGNDCRNKQICTYIYNWGLACWLSG